MEKFVRFFEDHGKYCVGTLVPSHYSKSLAAYSEMANEVKRCFPMVTDKDIECFVVVKSPNFNRQPVVRFTLPVGSHHPDWPATPPAHKFMQWVD